MNDREHSHPAPWTHQHPRLARVIGASLTVLGCGFGLFLMAAFLFGSPAGKIVQGIVLMALLATLTWLRGNWLDLVILVVLWRAASRVDRMIEERERIAQERHDAILETLHEIRDELRDERELREILDKPER
jgi:hypothetical protein